MARIKVTGPIGELSGKLGGQVFARNKAGYYVRANAFGTDPNTLAQVRARTAFSTASSAYHSLTDIQKSMWQSFATLDFVPKKGTPPGTLSGFNAFVSMRSVVESAEALKTTPTAILVNAISKTVIADAYQIPTTPPAAGMLQNGLVDNAGDPFITQISNPVVTASSGVLSAASVTLNALGVSAPPDVDSFRGAATTGNYDVGFALYASRGKQQANMFFENEEEYLVGTLPHLSFSTTVQFEDVVLPFTLVQAPSNYQSLPSAGQFTRLTVYTVSRTGMMTKLGAIVAQV